MKVLKKKDVIIFAGKLHESYLDCKYIGGLSDSYNKFKGQTVYIEKREKGVCLWFIDGWSRLYIWIKEEELLYINIFTPKVDKKKKSVIGRALLGGILLGPLGAVVGGLSGVGEKDIKGVENIITLKITHNNEENNILLACKNKRIKSFNKFINEYLFDKIKTTEELKTPEISVPDELLKLKSLLDQDILTPEEFDIQKQKLLNL